MDQLPVPQYSVATYSLRIFPWTRSLFGSLPCSISSSRTACQRSLSVARPGGCCCGGPDLWIDHDSLDEFLAHYVPRMEQLLRTLERVEARPAVAGNGTSGKEQRLSARMWDSWKTESFWFNYAARTCLDMDGHIPACFK